ncbi:hypothetical protein GCM10023321_50310 [Pseudonocardia eucalypti]|uniref:Uncharacterized protein n=1 Tax=Pseudonocardia eucalypti TaxID=648755 RepID=A0ABP9QKW9_9PSEU
MNPSGREIARTNRVFSPASTRSVACLLTRNSANAPHSSVRNVGRFRSGRSPGKINRATVATAAITADTVAAVANDWVSNARCRLSIQANTSNEPNMLSAWMLRTPSRSCRSSGRAAFRFLICPSVHSSTSWGNTVQSIALKPSPNVAIHARNPVPDVFANNQYDPTANPIAAIATARLGRNAHSGNNTRAPANSPQVVA